MKKALFALALTLTLISCKKSDVELEIEHYELQKVKLEYLEALMKTKEDLGYKRQRQIIDSLIIEEKNKLENESNQNQN